MKYLFFICSNLMAKDKPNECNCSYPLKTNVNWCKGPKGGIYCINRVGTKTYKPK